MGRKIAKKFGQPTNKGLNLLRFKVPSAVFFVYLHSMPLADSEVQRFMSKTGNAGNSWIRDSIKKLKDEGFLESDNAPRGQILKVKRIILADSDKKIKKQIGAGEKPKKNIYHEFPFYAEIKWGSIEKALPRYKVSTEFLEELIDLLNKNAKEDEKFVPKNSTADLLIILKNILEIHPKFPFLRENYFELREKNIIQYLQIVCFEFLVLREYMMEFIKSREHVKDVYTKVPTPHMRTLNHFGDLGAWRALKTAINSDIHLYFDKIVTPGSDIEDAIWAISSVIALPADDALDDLFKLFVFSYSAMNPFTRQVLSARWDKIKEKERRAFLEIYHYNGYLR